MINTNNIDSLIGANVVDTEGRKVGTVGQVYLDSTTNQPSWVTVKTGLFGTSESFAPLDSADWTGEELRIGFEKDFVKDAPRIDTDGSLESADEDALYRYYGLAGSNAGPGAGSAGTSADTRMDTGAGDRRSDEYDTASTDTARTDTAGTDAARTGTAGYDTAGAGTDDAMTRSEEQLHVGTERVSAGRARLRKHVVTENQTVTVPVSREEVTLEREPITDANRRSATSGPDLTEDEHEVQLTEERVVVDKETVPVERVRLGTETVTEDQRVSEDVRKEEIDFDESGIDEKRPRERDDSV
ncbi:DUF2382 domain-containing protein [Cryobacterium lactosi]|uniref:DUF2382 domain-containing protein n=1 Tax=Cryobacterium lactosi TaxID=1259202 RepID=A0A4R9BVP0_9MICO|nr:PRC and DUF2382 domain-containing protein [Cryobacterium lactosi]TFD90690.1 DUF2382 domain-containing protein [Cryobacterium lactosi]